MQSNWPDRYPAPSVAKPVTICGPKPLGDCSSEEISRQALIHVADGRRVLDLGRIEPRKLLLNNLRQEFGNRANHDPRPSPNRIRPA
jgi:hypothetical protein